MTHDQRLERDLGEIRERIGAAGLCVRQAVEEAVEALESGDKERLYGVVLGDHAVDRDIQAIDRLCHAFVARHFPSAAQLRMISAGLRLTIAIERIGDYAVSIARIAARFEQEIPAPVVKDLADITKQAVRMLERARHAFLENDAELARDTARMAKRVDSIHDGLFHELVEREEVSTQMLVGLVAIYTRLERVADQARTICNETLVAIAGDARPNKPSKVLFVERDGGFAAPLAVGIAQKAFPRSGRFACAAWEPAEELHPVAKAVAEKLSLDLPHTPDHLSEDAPPSSKTHVIVVLDHKGDLPIGPVPFQSIVQRWRVGVADAVAKGEGKHVVRELSGRIRDLMETLRGEDTA